jgi:KDO2-lipid IV(A) lauroyltransferase
MKNKALKKARNFLLVVIIQVLRFIIFFIPWKAGKAIGGAIGMTAYYLVPKERAKIFRNLDLVYGAGKMTDAEKISFARDNCRNYGIGFFEFAKFSVWPSEKIASLIREVAGIEYFDRAISEGKPYIAVTAHIGNWEIMPVFTALKWKKVGAIGKRIFDPTLDSIVNATRLKAGYNVYDKDNISRDMIKGLKEGMILGMLVDQDTNVESMIVPFLGLAAKTPVAPAMLAKKFHTYIGTVFINRRDDGYYKLTINEPYIPSENDTIESIALKYNNEISEMIRKYPHQWVWIHERWKSTIKQE